MRVETFNRFIQFGFPKDYYLATGDEWERLYEEKTCPYTSKLLLEDDVELEALDDCWLESDGADYLPLYINIEEAVDNYEDLRVNSPFYIEQPIVIISEDAFLPDYWENHRRYTSYSTGYKVGLKEEEGLTLSYLTEEGDWKLFNKAYTHGFYSHTGYQIIPIYESKRTRVRGFRKTLGYSLNYKEYIMSSTPELIEKIKTSNDIHQDSLELYLTISDLCLGTSYHPENHEAVLKLLSIATPLITKHSRDITKYILNKQKVKQQEELGCLTIH